MSDQEKYYQYVENPLQYNTYLANPDSKASFPELNKDLSISNITPKMQRVILIKGRVGNYLQMLFSKEVMKDKDGNILVDDEGTPITYISKSATSFMRDIMAIGVTSQGLNATLLTKLTENVQNISHSYAMDKNYKKNIGGN